MSGNRTIVLLATLLVFLNACGTVQVRIEYPSTTDPQAEATLIVQATEHARLATEVAALEATLGIASGPITTAVDTAESLPSPIPGDEPGVFYQPVPLDGAAYAPTGFASPPTGQQTLGGIPFELTASIFKSQSSSSPGGSPTNVLFSMDVPHASKVHLLLNTGNGFTQFEGQSIGQVVVTCDGERVVVTDLVLGRDVREWHLAHNVVYTASHARQVWTGALAQYPHLTGHVDLVSFDLPAACQEGTLNTIEVVDASTDTVGSLDPALNLFGVTIEHRQ